MIKKLLVFDFDQTLTKYSLFDQYKLIAIDGILNVLSFITNSGKMIHKSVPYSFFNDYKDLYTLFIKLKKENYALCIASFNKSYYIKQFVNVVFPDIFDHILGSDNIQEYVNKYLDKNIKLKIVNHKIIDKSCPEGYGKNVMMQVLSKIYKLPYNKIYFFDDNKNNIICSEKELGINGFNNTKDGINKKIVENFLYNK
jgi:hypothetical protein